MLHTHEIASQLELTKIDAINHKISNLDKTPKDELSKQQKRKRRKLIKERQALKKKHKTIAEFDTPDYEGEPLSVLDTESTSQPNYEKDGYVRVWAAYWEHEDGRSFKSTNLEDMFFHLAEQAKRSDIQQFNKNEIIEAYVHNLKWDIELILPYLYEAGFIDVSEDVDLDLIKPFSMRAKTFTISKTEMGAVYNIRIQWERRKTITLRDSLKLFPATVAQLGKNLDKNGTMLKGEIDYEMYRPEGYVPTRQEWDYIVRDVRIVLETLRQGKSFSLGGHTSSSEALEWHKFLFGKDKWKRHFPELDADVDAFFRASYRGGWTYANSRYVGELQGDTVAYDANSMYPTQMRKNFLPYGMPRYFEGAPDDRVNSDKWSYVIRVKIWEANLKPGHFPSVQIKTSKRYPSNKWLERFNEVNLFFTQPDLELLLENYDIEGLNGKHGWDGLDFVEGYYVKTKKGMFDKYLDYFGKMKEDASKSGDMVMRAVAKLRLNGLYGKFGTRADKMSKHSYVDGEGVVKYRNNSEVSHGKSIYIPMATFITSYARKQIIESATANFDRFIYADTDSLKLIDTGEQVDLILDQNKLGAWKQESGLDKKGNPDPQADIIGFLTFGAKCYAYKTRDGKMHSTIAGATEAAREMIKDFDDFFIGAIYPDTKLQPVRVKGGPMLVSRDFTINNRNAILF